MRRFDAPSLGDNMVIFLLFFGIALVDAIAARSWWSALFWMGVCLIFMLMSRRKRSGANERSRAPVLILAILFQPVAAQGQQLASLGPVSVDHDHRPEWHVLVEPGDGLITQPDAPMRHGFPDGVLDVGAVQADAVGEQQAKSAERSLDLSLLGSERRNEQRPVEHELLSGGQPLERAVGADDPDLRPPHQECSPVA
jgi:hypothetical protein